jgi:outer membrane protein assembly factor BamD (BamD/ComL family)
VASRWPQYEHAHLAQYRAGLAYLKAGSTREGVLAMQALIRNFPNSPYVKDAHLNIAKAWETGGDKEKAADAYAEFADRYPKDESAADAWLKAADLYAAAGLVQRADQLRLAYIKKFPNDIETAMERTTRWAVTLRAASSIRSRRCCRRPRRSPRRRRACRRRRGRPRPRPQRPRRRLLRTWPST